MQLAPIIQGRRVNQEDLSQIRTWLAEHPSWHRTRLSRELCGLWGWRSEAGQLKDMACRTLLLKLQDRGWIDLPARQRASVNGLRNRSPVEVPHEDSPLHTSLEAVQPLRVDRVTPGTPEARLFQFLLHRYHYLSHRNCVGENLKYLVSDRHGRPLACLLFGSAAWKCRPRDAFIGWSKLAQQQGLRFLTNNTRFLILPWVQVPHLASHILSLITRRLSADWQDQYGHPIHLVETFVERGRFSGTCYRAAGWIPVGTTTGRGRNAPGMAAQGPLKEVLLKPLGATFRQQLCA
jgi:Druantia protein DruA